MLPHLLVIEGQNTYCPFGVNYFFMLGLKIEASKSPTNDLKVVSVIEMTNFYDPRGSFWSLRLQNTFKLQTQSALS